MGWATAVNSVTAYAPTLLIAATFVMTGDLLLRRRSRSVTTINESFLVGLTVFAALVFPVSLAAGAHTVNVVVGMLCVAAALWSMSYMSQVASYVSSARHVWARQLPRYIRTHPRDTVLWAILFLYLFGISAAMSKMPIVSDGLHIWASKATVLYHKGVTRELWTEGGYDSRVTGYPFLIPLYEALVGKVIGQFSFFHLSPIFVVLQLSLLTAMYSAVRSCVGNTVALCATICLGILPPFFGVFAFAGFADMPLAAISLALTSAWLRFDPAVSTLHSPIPWLTAGLLTVKAEGIVLFAVAVAVPAVASLASMRGAVSLSRINASWTALLLGALMLRVAYLSWITATDPTYGPFNRFYVTRALFIMPDILRLCWREAADFSKWGWLWPAFAMSIPLVAVAGRAVERAVAGAVLLVIGCYTVIFGFSNWGYAYHIANAYSRLLMHVAPVAILVIVFALRIVIGGWHESPRMALASSRSRAVPSGPGDSGAS